MSEIIETSQTSSPKPEKSSTKKAIWSTVDDEVLVTVLKEQKSGGFQTDNGGFHNDAYKAASIKLAFSMATSKGPQKTSEMCKTRWGTLKKNLKDVKSIREKSGFGWDAERAIATATDQVWEDLIKSKPKLKCWRKKSFPLYDQILDLIEGQVATGGSVFFPGVLGAVGPLEGEAGSEEEDNNSDEEEDSARVTSSQTPARRPLVQNSSTDFATPATVSRKRVPAMSDLTERPAKRAHGRKPTQSDAGFEMAEAVRDLARSAMGDNNPSVLSPARKTRAIACVENNNELSDNKMIDAFKLIRRDTSVADTYLAIHCVKHRTRFIQAEISAAAEHPFV
ncbi:hypothetical protein BDP27DRAFT_1360517 [Rhodocollybia butyracea]|uniref:Myb/SANT-like domain-containing protein n=1 Tax=Rhodocollybia butyracea TaxID=206335 RepID=A0A9P5PV52_9AGAR|nr:hypothetical protein BDP27DRAFT_1360517 [Rhodocollybia butyracea]